MVDNNGNKVAVKPVDIAAGDTTVYFEFVTPFAADYEFKGVWKIAGIEIDFDLKAKLEAFVDAGNDQIKLYKALTDLGIENVKMENMPVYADKHDDFLAELEEDETELTVEAIQAWINKVNAGTISDAESRAIAKKVNDAIKAENDVALLAALQDPAFVRVNPEWLGDYKAAIKAVDAEADKDTVAEIQAIIDVVNTTNIKTELEKLQDGNVYTCVDKEKLLAAKDLIAKYAPVNDKGEIIDTAIKAAPKAIDIQLAVADVLAATTPTTLKAKLTALDNLLDKNDKFMKDYYIDANAKLYINGIAGTEIKGLKGNENVKTATGENNSVVSVLKAINTAVEQAQERINNKLAVPTVTIVDDIYDSKAKGPVRRLGYGISNVGVVEGTINDTDSLVVELYKGETLLGKMSLNAYGYENYGEETTISGTIDAYGEYVSTSWNNEWYGKLTDRPDKVKVTAVIKGDGTAVKEEPLEFSDEDMQPFYLQLVNDAETVAEMDAALLKLAEIGNTDYLNVPKADRPFVAEKVLEVRNAIEDTKKFANYTALETALTGATEARNEALKGINDLTAEAEIADVIDALKAVDPEGFGKMSIDRQADIAEAFFEGLEFAEETPFTVTPAFRTLAAVKAAAGL